MAQSILVTGATGMIGPFLVQRLADMGYDVHAFGRRPPISGLFPSSVEYLQGDLTDEGSIRGAVQGKDIVIHLAAMLHIENPSAALDAQYEAVNVRGSQLLAEYAAQAGCQRLVYASTVKVYGQASKVPLTEQAATHPQTTYARTKLAGENAVRQVAGLETVTLRLSAVYGPRLQGSWERLFKAVDRGLFVPIGSLDNQRSLTYVDDIVAALVLGATHPEATNGIYNVVGHVSPTLADILDAMYQAAGRSRPPFTLPVGPVKAMVSAAGSIFQLFGRRFPLTIEAIDQMTVDETYSNAALRDLGFSPAYTLETGWERVFSAARSG